MLERLIHIFGHGNVYVELQRHFERAEEHRNQAAVRLARALQLPLVATNGVHYATAYEREVLDVLTSIRHDCTLDAAGRLLAPNAERYLRGSREMRQLFRDLPEAIDNTLALSARLAFRMSELGYRLSGLSRPRGRDNAVISGEAHRRRYSRALPSQARCRTLCARTEAGARELALIAKLGLAGYFLIVWDIVQFCQRNGILAQGRGSAANSVVCYALASPPSIRSAWTCSSSASSVKSAASGRTSISTCPAETSASTPFNMSTSATASWARR